MIKMEMNNRGEFMLSINADGRLVFSFDEDSDNCAIVSPSVSLEKGKSGSVQFTMLPNHYLYNSIKRMKTTITVMDGDRCIFYGRVLHLTTDTYKQRVVYCEGALSFLKDAIIQNNLMHRKRKEVFERMIADYNELVDENRRFTIGRVTIDDYETKNASVNSDRTFSDALSTINNDLVQYVDGYLSTRYENGVLYLDWLKEGESVSNQVIRFGMNIVSYSKYDPSDTIYTMLFPTTSEGLTVDIANSGSRFVPVSEELVAEYGRIYKTVEFENVSSPYSLYDRAVEYNQKHANEQPEEFTITALDLSEFGVNVDEIKVGDKVRIVSEPHGIDDYYTCHSIRMPNLAMPGKNEYKFQNVIQDFKEPDVGYSSFNEPKEKTLTEQVQAEKEKTNIQTTEIRSAVDAFIAEVDGRLTIQDDNIEIIAKDYIDIKGKQVTIEGNVVDLQGDIVRLEGEDTRIESLTVVIGGKADSASADAAEALAKSVTINGEIVTINGQLTEINSDLTSIKNLYVNEFSALQGEVETLSAGNFGTKGLSAYDISTVTGDIDELSVGSINGTMCYASTLTIGGKSVTFFAPEDATFKLSDMPGYADAIRTATNNGITEGRSQVHVAKIEQPAAATYNRDTKRYTVPVLADTNYPGQNTSMSGDLNFSASAAFDHGVETVDIESEAISFYGDPVYNGDGMYRVGIIAEASNGETGTAYRNFDASEAFEDGKSQGGGGEGGTLEVVSAESYFTVQAGKVYLIRVHFSNGTTQTTTCTIN